MRVLIKRFAEEICNDPIIGEIYAGYIKINEEKFDFKLRLKAQEKSLASIIRKKIGIGRIIEFSLGKKGVKINIANEDNYREFLFFYGLLTDLGDGLCVPIGLTREDLIDFPRRVCEMLNSPKFDCKISL